MQSPSGFGNTDNSWWIPFPHLPKTPKDRGSWAGKQEMKGLFPGATPWHNMLLQPNEGHPVPGVQLLQGTACEHPNAILSNCRAALHRAPGERLQQLQLQLDEGLHWHRKCPSIPNCKYHTGIPLDQARKQSKGLQPRGQQGPTVAAAGVVAPH